MNYGDNSEIQIEQKKLNRLKATIYKLERDNLKRKPPLTKNEMVEKIRKVIEEEVNKCY